MKYRFEGETYEYDGKMTVQDAIDVFDRSGLGVGRLLTAVTQGHPAGIAAFMFMLMRRADKAVRWDDMKSMDVTSFELVPEGNELAEARERWEAMGKALVEAEAQEAAALAAVKKNSNGGKPRKNATATTS